MYNIKRVQNSFKNFGRVLTSLIISLTFTSVSLAEKVEDLNINKYVNDYANIIDDNVESELESRLYANFSSTTNQIVVVTVNNIDGDYIEHYSIKLAEKIKAGNEKIDNGVILLVSKDDRLMRIEVGYGLEPYLTDGKSNYIRDNILLPSFKKGDYTGGIAQAVDQIILVTNDLNYESGQSEAPSSFVKEHPYLYNFLGHAPLEVFFFLFIFIFSIFQWIVSVMARSKSWWLGGILGFVLSALLYFLVFTSLFFFILVILGFVFDFFISKNYKEHILGKKKGPADWWAGGNWGGGSNSWGSGRFGGSSHSSGGFSSGGGSFGGGGSSGSW